MLKITLFVALSALITTESTENICARNITIGKSILGAMNLSYPGLEAVSSAASHRNYNLACEALVEYYKTSNSSSKLRRKIVTPGTKRIGGAIDAMVEHDIYALAGVDTTAKVPRLPDGGLDWTYKGPNNDPEFMNCLNRKIK